MSIPAKRIPQIPYVISTAKSTDYDQLIALWEASVRATHGFLEEEDIQHYKFLIYNYYFDSLKLYCIRDSTTINGFIGLKDNFIQMLFVAPPEMSKGIGKSLVNFAICKHTARTVDVNEQNTIARQFYNKMGFVIKSRCEVDSAGRNFPVLSLELV